MSLGTALVEGAKQAAKELGDDVRVNETYDRIVAEQAGRIRDVAAEIVKAEQPFDFSAFDEIIERHEKGREVRLVHPETGADLNVVFVVAGPESKRYRTAQAKALDRRVEEQRVDRLTVEETQGEIASVWADCVIDWRTGDDHVVIVRGKKITCTPDAVRSMFKHWPFVLEQVQGAWSPLLSSARR